MKTRLKGINSIRKELADGSWVTYWYAWKSGPRVYGEPGTPEFIDSYNEAVASKRPVVGKTLLSLTRYFQTTSEFKNDVKPRTRDDYVKQIKIIEKKFGDFPVSGLSDPRARDIFKEWRDELANRSIRQADYAWTVLARVLSISRGAANAKGGNRRDYSRPAKWGSGLRLHGSNPEVAHVRFGSNADIGEVRLMSALPPKADIAQHWNPVHSAGTSTQ